MKFEMIISEIFHFEKVTEKCQIKLQIHKKFDKFKVNLIFFLSN